MKITLEEKCARRKAWRLRRQERELAQAKADLIIRLVLAELRPPPAALPRDPLNRLWRHPPGFRAW